MDYETAMDEETTVSLIAAFRELRRHDVNARLDGETLIDSETGEAICTARNGEFSTAAILAYLGY